MGTTPNQDGIMVVFLQNGVLSGRYAQWDAYQSLNDISKPVALIAVFKYNEGSPTPYRDNFYSHDVYFIGKPAEGKIRVTWSDTTANGTARDFEYRATALGGGAQIRDWSSKNRGAAIGELNFQYAFPTETQIEAAQAFEASDCS